MGVFEAAGLPLRSVRHAMRVLGAEMPLISSGPDRVLGAELPLISSGPDEGGDGVSGGDSGAVEDIVAEAMCQANEAGLYRATMLLFQEALLRGGGKLSHAGVMKQVWRRRV